MKTDSTGVTKVARLISALGTDLMIPIIKRLPRETVSLIRDAANKEKTMVKSEAISILKEFNKMGSVLVGADGGIDSLLEEYDEAKMADSPEGAHRRLMVGFEKLAQLPVEKIYEIINDEDPLYKVVILKQLKDKVSVDLFSMMTVDEQVDFTIEAEKSTEVSNDVLMVISNIIEDKLEDMLSEKRSNFDTVINLASTLDEEKLNELLEKLPEDTAMIIRQSALTFADIVKQEKDILKKILAKFNGVVIAAAACKLSQNEMEYLCGCITSTKKEELEYNLGEINTEDKKLISEAQRQIVTEAKAMRQQGDIEIIK